jgi:tRNA 2-thiouridine synthesizing protein E
MVDVMPELVVGNRNITVDKSGFMLDPNDWTIEIAEALAKLSSLHPLTEDHWRVITYVRAYYEEHHTAPMLRAVLKRTKLKESRLRILFPRSCRECICMIAGLPKGTG